MKRIYHVPYEALSEYLAIGALLHHIVSTAHKRLDTVRAREMLRVPQSRQRKHTGLTLRHHFTALPTALIFLPGR